MIKEIKLEKLGLTMETGTIVRWLKKEGDFIEEGEEFFEVESDKGTTAVESIHSGYLKRIVIHSGDEVPVNTVIAYIGEADDEFNNAYPSE